MAQPQIRPAAGNLPVAPHVEAALAGAAQAKSEKRDERAERRKRFNKERKKSLEKKAKEMEKRQAERKRKRDDRYKKELEDRKRRRLEGGKSEKVETREITYVTGTETTPNLKAILLNKTFMQDTYTDSTFKKLKTQFFFLETEEHTQMFSVRQGNDYQVFSLLPQEKEKHYKQETRYGVRFADVAKTADKAAAWLRQTKPKTYSNLKSARERVGKDVNRMAGNRKPRELYGILLTGMSGLLAFAAIIRADKARVRKATPYIEEVLKDGTESFAKRFSGNKPLYVGTGPEQGPSELREKTVKEGDGYGSDYSSDEDNSKNKKNYKKN